MAKTPDLAIAVVEGFGNREVEQTPTVEPFVGFLLAAVALAEMLQRQLEVSVQCLQPVLTGLSYIVISLCGGCILP